MGSGISRGSYEKYHRKHGNTYQPKTKWSDDDNRVAGMTILLIALGWVIFKIFSRRRHKGSEEGWLEGLVSFGDRGARSFVSAEELVSEMKDAGVTRAGLIVGVDFTRSNEWTGQRCYGKGSMHDVSGPEPNPYQEVLEAVGRGLAPLNASKNIWCYGFGDETTKDEGVFCFMTDDQPCKNLHQMMDRYARIAPEVSLYGPTSFAPLIRKAIEVVEGSGGQYHCLVIIADGQVTKERDTVKAIQDASSHPLSIIMVGVGEGPWDTCRVFDTRLPGRRFDNFRFLEHRRVKRRNSQALALSALAEVPDQYRAIRALGLIRDTPRGAGDIGDVTPRADAFQQASAPVPVTASVPGVPFPEETSEEELPQGFICPLTLEVMIDPVVCEDGHSYERGAIEAWLKNHNIGPMSNVRLKSTAVVPNHALRNSIETWRQKREF